MIVIGLLFVVRNLTEYFHSPIELSVVNIIHDYLYKSPFGSMAIGALAAIGLRRNWSLRWMGSRFVWLFLWTSLLTIFATQAHIKYAYLEICAILFAGLILSSIYRNNTFLDWHPLRKLGRISYGIYMYHTPVIPCVILLLKWLNFEYLIEVGLGVPYILIIIALTIAVASLSYRYIELPFLRRK